MKYFTVACSSVEQEKDFGGCNVQLVLGQSVSILLRMGCQRSACEESTGCFRQRGRSPFDPWLCLDSSVLLQSALLAVVLPGLRFGVCSHHADYKTEEAR